MSSSDSDEGERRLPAAYRLPQSPSRRRRRRREISSSSSSSRASSSEDNRRHGRRHHVKKGDARGKTHRKREKKDRPMWKEEGEISCDSESSSSSSSHHSRDRDRRKRNERSERPRRREKGPVLAHKCNECGCNHKTLKGLIHHQLNDHNLGAQCHLCQKTFETKKTVREHYELEHTQEVVKCIFCKSPFDQPLEMKGAKWDEFFSHIYGEIFYSRLADLEQ